MTNKFNNKDLKIITVHSPEFHYEKDVSSLKKKVKDFDLSLPVYVDNDLRYFGMLRSDGWPSMYLIDKHGHIRFIYLGETHSYFAQARHIEQNIGRLLAEK